MIFKVVIQIVKVTCEIYFFFVEIKYYLRKKNDENKCEMIIKYLFEV